MEPSFRRAAALAINEQGSFGGLVVISHHFVKQCRSRLTPRQELKGADNTHGLNTAPIANIAGQVYSSTPGDSFRTFQLFSYVVLVVVSVEVI
jgi:hypothetical protein